MFSTTKGIVTNNTQFSRLNAMQTNYSFGSYAVGADVMYLMAFTFNEGEVLNNVDIPVFTAGTGLCRVGIYNAVEVSGQIVPGNLIQDLGTVDVTTTGTKTISGIGLSLPATVDSFYFFAIIPEGGFGISSASFNDCVTFVPYVQTSSFSSVVGSRWGGFSTTAPYASGLPAALPTTGWAFPSRFLVMGVH